jgi:SNF2 family DNA or RNA helicase
VVRRAGQVKVEKPQVPAPAFASSAIAADPDYWEETGNKGKKPAAGPYAAAGNNNLVKSVSSSLVDYLDDDDEESEEEEKENRKKTTPKATAASKREVKAEKPQVPASPFAAAFAEDEKENRGKEDVGWEKTEDFKMEPTGCGVMVKPYKLPGDIFKMLYPHQREGLKWLWVLHCRGTGGILGDDMGLGKTMQVWPLSASSFSYRVKYRLTITRQIYLSCFVLLG